MKTGTDQLRILYISSANPVAGPGAIALEHYEEMKKMGLSVDFMTLHPIPDRSDILFVQRDSSWGSLMKKVKAKLMRCSGYINGNHFFFYRKENHPPIRVSKVLKKVQKNYNWVIIYFWQGMLSFKTVDAIYEKLHHPVVFFLSPDYSHMSGGCHFPGDCVRYTTGCGCCPAFGSLKETDFTAWNVRYRERFYAKVRPVVYGNTYMKLKYDRSLLLKNARTVIGTLAIKPDMFYPVDKKNCRGEFALPTVENAFIIAFGCQALTDPRKGMAFLFEAFQRWRLSLSQDDADRVTLLVAGSEFDKISERLHFNAVGLGRIAVSRLPDFYSAADIFVCPSIDDPGPSMVLQSIACGTPVVGFEMGAMLDYVKDKGTG